VKENSIEEDIERIAKLITTKFNNDYSIDNVDKEAIEELLKAYKELKEIEESHRKENGKLRERVKELEEWNEYYRKEMLSKEYIKLNYIPKSKLKDIIDRIDYDIKKTKEIISKNTNIYASYRKNDYQIVRLKAMNTKSLDIKKRLQELLESEE